MRSSRLASQPTPRAEISASGPRRSSRHTLDDQARAGGNEIDEEDASGSGSDSSEGEDEDEKEAAEEAESAVRYTFRDRASAKRHVSNVSASAREVAAALHPSKSRLPQPGSSRAVPPLSRRSSRRHGSKASSSAAPSSDYARNSSRNPRKRARSPMRQERPRYGGGGGGGYSSGGSSSSGSDSSSDNYPRSGGHYNGRPHRSGGSGSGYYSSGSSSSDDYLNNRSHSKSSRRRGRDHGAHYGAGSGGGLNKGSGGSSLEVLRADAAPLDADTRTSWDMVKSSYKPLLIPLFECVSL